MCECGHCSCDWLPKCEGEPVGYLIINGQQYAYCNRHLRLTLHQNQARVMRHLN